MSNNVMCNDNRFEVIEELKNYIIEATNIETSPKEMEVLDDICFRLWQLDLTLETKRKLKKLENENESLKNIIETDIKDLDKYRKAIDIWKRATNLELYTQKTTDGWNFGMYLFGIGFRLTYDQYELLKEVLEND